MSSVTAPPGCGRAARRSGRGARRRWRRRPSPCRPATGSGIDQCSQSSGGSSSSWARSQTVITSGGRPPSSSSDRGARAVEVEPGPLGGGDRAGMDPVGRVGAGRLSRRVGHERHSAAASWLRAEFRVHTNSAGPGTTSPTVIETRRASRERGGRSGGGRRRSSGAARSARPARARRGDGPAGSTRPRPAGAARAATDPTSPARRRSPSAPDPPTPRAAPPASRAARLSRVQSISLTKD